MSDLVANVRARDTGRDITALLNTIAAEHGISAVELLAGAVVAEGAWNEHAIRERTWPDVSYGFGQPAVKWFDYRAAFVPKFIARHTTLEADGTMADTPGNREDVQSYMWDAERALRYVAPRYAALRARSATALDAWCLWNKPGIPPADNPNRAHYARSLTEAEQYRVKEESVSFTIPKPVREEFPAGSDGDEEYRKSLLEYAVAAVSVDENGVAVSTMQELNPVRYADLGKA